MEVEGGCACGAVRYLARIEPDKAYWCHCRMCQRALGAVAVAFINTAKADVCFTAGAPHEWQSSPIARRGRCDVCGTPLTFHYPDSDRIDLTVASLDAPASLRPTSHFGVESHLPHWVALGDLPATRADEHGPLQARWAGERGGPE